MKTLVGLVPVSAIVVYGQNRQDLRTRAASLQKARSNIVYQMSILLNVHVSRIHQWLKDGSMKITLVPEKPLPEK